MSLTIGETMKREIENGTKYYKDLSKSKETNKKVKEPGLEVKLRKSTYSTKERTMSE